MAIRAKTSELAAEPAEAARWVAAEAPPKGEAASAGAANQEALAAVVLVEAERVEAPARAVPAARAVARAEAAAPARQVRGPEATVVAREPPVPAGALVLAEAARAVQVELLD